MCGVGVKIGYNGNPQRTYRLPHHNKGKSRFIGLEVFPPEHAGNCSLGPCAYKAYSPPLSSSSASGGLP